MKMLLYLSASSVSPTCMMRITVTIVIMMIMSDLDAQGLSAAVQIGKDHVAAPGIIIDSVPADHGECIRGDIFPHAGGHW